MYLLFEVLSLQNLLITIFIIFSEYNTNLSPGEGGHREFGLKVKGVRSITPPIATMVVICDKSEVCLETPTSKLCSHSTRFRGCSHKSTSKTAVEGGDSITVVDYCTEDARLNHFAAGFSF